MNQKILTAEQITDYLGQLGATGSAKIENLGLYTRREENASWMYCGAVEDADDAQQIIDEYFE